MCACLLGVYLLCTDFLSPWYFLQHGGTHDCMADGMELSKSRAEMGCIIVFCIYQPFFREKEQVLRMQVRPETLVRFGEGLITKQFTLCPALEQQASPSRFRHPAQGGHSPLGTGD